MVLLVMGSPSVAAAADVTLAWNPATDGVTTGYIVYYGTAPQAYTQQIDVGNVTTFVFTGLQDGTTYYFAVRAYDAIGNLSDASAEVSETTAPPAGTNLVSNGGFAGGAGSWFTFATPDPTHIVWNVSGDVFRFYRQPDATGAANQAVLLQHSGTALPAGSPLRATFRLGNSSSVRKRISVLVLDGDFSDLSVCTFWLPPNAPLQPYGMQTHTTKPWKDTAIYFYAASAGSDGGYYLVDDVSLVHDPAVSATTTRCVDATAPSPVSAADSADWIGNGGFTNGPALAPWSLFGQIGAQVVNGVFEFVRLADAPAGVVLQATGQAAAANDILTSTFELGNSSTVRKRVTVILHDGDFSDLSACTFWLEPSQPMLTYGYRTFATKSWANATVSVYPATIGSEQWMRLDNVTLRRTPSAAIVGTECLEPSSGGDAIEGQGTTNVIQATVARSGNRPADRHLAATKRVADAGAGIEPGTSGEPNGAVADWWLPDGFVPVGNGGDRGWAAVAGEPAIQTLQLALPVDLRSSAGARLRFESRLEALTSRADVQVSADGIHWLTVQEVIASDDWAPVEVDLSPFHGQIIFVRLTLATFVGTGDVADQWQLHGLQFVPATPLRIAR